MISTNELQLLPDGRQLQTACKAMAVLDAILSQDWVYRYHSYNCAWSDEEEFFEMRNGEGDQLLILFTARGVVINGLSSAAELVQKDEVTGGLPEIFHEFMFGEPVNSAGTTFCVWKLIEGQWSTGKPAADHDHSEELLSPLDGKPETYLHWALNYFKGNYKESGIPPELVTAVYKGELLTKRMVLSVVEEPYDWDLLKEDLEEISYPYHITD